MEFLAESYFEVAEFEAAEQLAVAAALASPDDSVRHLRTISLPGDDTLLFLYEAPSADEVRRALDLAGIACDRISPARTHPAVTGD